MAIDWKQITTDEINATIANAKERMAEWEDAIKIERLRVRPYRDELTKRRKEITAAKKAAEAEEVANRPVCKWTYTHGDGYVSTCSRKTKAESGFCRIHDPATPRCEFDRCGTVISKERQGQRFCGRHDPDTCASSYCNERRQPDAKFCKEHTPRVRFDVDSFEMSPWRRRDMPATFDIDEAMRIE